MSFEIKYKGQENGKGMLVGYINQMTDWLILDKLVWHSMSNVSGVKNKFHKSSKNVWPPPPQGDTPQCELYLYPPSISSRQPKGPEV